jgi:hypothetical protein
VAPDIVVVSGDQLKSDGAALCVDDAREIDQQVVADGFDGAPAILGYPGVQHFAADNALRSATRLNGDNMIGPAERMKMMRARRRREGLRELRLIVPDARSEAVRNRIATQVAKLNPQSEREALLWIEAVSEFDANEPR